MVENIGIYNYSKLLGMIREQGKTQNEVAQAAKINPATLNQKLRGKGLKKKKEISAICLFLKIPPSEIGVYFFNS